MFEMDPALADFTRRKLEERGVEVWLNSKVAAAADGEVRLADGRTLATRTLIWSACSPQPLAGESRAGPRPHRPDHRRPHHARAGTGRRLGVG